MLPERKKVLGVGVHPLTLSEAVAVIGGWIREYRSCGKGTEKQADAPESSAGSSWVTRQVVTLNAEILYNAQHDPRLRDLLNQADLVVPDGYGVIWAGRRFGHHFPEQVAGIDLVSALAAAGGAEGWRFFLLGAAAGVAEEAAANLVKKAPGLQVVGTHHGYFSQDEEATVLKKVREANPDILLVALGAPKQEFFINRHKERLGACVAIGVGGSFDVLSGRVPRAPHFLRKLHLEWLYRISRDPSRWGRALALPRFAWMVLRKTLF